MLKLCVGKVKVRWLDIYNTYRKILKVIHVWVSMKEIETKSLFDKMKKEKPTDGDHLCFEFSDSIVTEIDI